MIANGPRGEVTLIIDGAPRTLCLTLGALAALETAFGAESVEELAVRLSKLSAADLIVVVAALGGLRLETVANARIDLAEAARAVGDAFERAFA